MFYEWHPPLFVPGLWGYLGLLFTSEKQQQDLETLRDCPDHRKLFLALVRFLVVGKGEQQGGEYHPSKAGGAQALRPHPSTSLSVLILARVITSVYFSFLFSKMGGGRSYIIGLLC